MFCFLEITAEVNPELRISVPDSRRFQLETVAVMADEIEVAGRVEGRPSRAGVAGSRRVAVARGGVRPHLASSVNGGARWGGDIWPQEGSGGVQRLACLPAAGTGALRLRGSRLRKQLQAFSLSSWLLPPYPPLEKSRKAFLGF